MLETHERSFTIEALAVKVLIIKFCGGPFFENNEKLAFLGRLGSLEVMNFLHLIKEVLTRPP